MGTGIKYVYFPLNSRHLKLLLAAILRGIERCSSMGQGPNKPLYYEEAEELKAIHGMLATVSRSSRSLATVILSETQFDIASIAITTAHLALDDSQPLKKEYSELIAIMKARRISRRSASRDEFAVKAPDQKTQRMN